MKLVCLAAMLFLGAACQMSYVYGNAVHEIEWINEGPRWILDKYFARGLCYYRFDQLYEPGDVLLNVTFDREISDFDDFMQWTKNQSSPGFWYYSESTSQYNPGQPVRIEFNIHWDVSQGMAPPTGRCETNVGDVITTTASTLRTPGPVR